MIGNSGLKPRKRLLLLKKILERKILLTLNQIYSVTIYATGRKSIYQFTINTKKYLFKDISIVV